MRKYKIWVEGYAATGNQAGASLLGTEEANSFEEAIEKYMEKNPGKINVRNRGGINIYTDWGCRLYDNEFDARKDFG